MLLHLDAKWSTSGFVDHVIARSCLNYIQAVCVESDVINDIVKRLETQRFDPGALCKDHTKERPFLEYAIQFGFAHAKVADLNGFPRIYLFQSTITNATGKASCVSWWTSFTSIFRQYWKRGYHMSHGHPIKHWSECGTSQMAFACAYQLDCWLHYLLRENQSKLDKLDLSQALCVTVMLGHEKSIASLIGAGADVNHEQPIFGSPLYLALVSGRDDITAMLLEHRAAVRMGERKRSPLITATLRRPTNIVRLFLDRGAEVAERESTGTYHEDDGWILGKHALEAALGRDPRY
jgi:hypothetical protein